MSTDSPSAAARDLRRLLGGQAEHAQHALGVEPIGVLRRRPSSTSRMTRAARRRTRIGRPACWGREPAGPDAALEVSPREWAERLQARSERSRRITSHPQSGSLRARLTKERCAAATTSAGSSSSPSTASIAAPWAATVSAKHRLDDRLLGVEVVVKQTEADVRLIGDLVDPRVVDALAGEQRARGVEQPAAGARAGARGGRRAARPPCRAELVSRS